MGAEAVGSAAPSLSAPSPPPRATACREPGPRSRPAPHRSRGKDACLPPGLPQTRGGERAAGRSTGQGCPALGRDKRLQANPRLKLNPLRTSVHLERSEAPPWSPGGSEAREEVCPPPAPPGSPLREEARGRRPA